MSTSAATMERTFAAVESAAIAGERCPMNTERDGTVSSKALSELAHQGRIRIEISRHNWRQVVILSGPYAGKMTLWPPKGIKPWKVIGKQTHVDPRGKQKLIRISAPRDYSGGA